MDFVQEEVRPLTTLPLQLRSKTRQSREKKIDKDRLC